ncbi:hypothetical protein CBL_07745 [Carabus blaptoides fortunei]
MAARRKKAFRVLIELHAYDINPSIIPPTSAATVDVSIAVCRPRYTHLQLFLLGNYISRQIKQRYAMTPRRSALNMIPPGNPAHVLDGVDVGLTPRSALDDDDFGMPFRRDDCC